MPEAFSFSAPRFSAEDNEREASTMTDEERLEVRNDLYGTYTLPTETIELISRCMASMEECITQIPEKEAYLVAQERCPELFTTESAPIRFLRSEAYNPEQAANKIIMYWKTRVSIFNDRAFLPLRLEGGALRQHDLDELICGHTEILRNDKHNRLVLCHDRSKFRTHGLDHPSVLRSIWYVVHAALEENEQYCRNGIVYVIPSKNTVPQHFSRKYIKLMWSSIRDCLPVQLRAIHACHPTPVTDLMLPVIKQVMGRYLRRRWQSHIGTMEEVLTTLEEFGLESANLPRSIGGMYAPRIVDWIEQRRVYEQHQAAIEQRTPLIDP